MYKRVETKEEFQIAKELHQEIFSKEGFIVEEMSTESIQYLFYNEKRKPIGLVEFTPYNPNGFTTVENDFPFSQLEELQKHQSTSWEVDKLGIISDERNNGHFGTVLECIIEFAKIHNITRYVALLNVLVYRLFRISYSNVSVRKVGTSFRSPGEKLKIVPVLFDVQESIRAIEQEEKTR